MIVSTLRVGMFGFSLGGFTTLVEIGGIPDLASNDEQVPDAWNTAVVREELPKTPEGQVVNGAGHFAFLPPCGEALAKQVPQICIDGPGFDRQEFHRDFNREVVGFFQKTLIPYR